MPGRRRPAIIQEEDLTKMEWPIFKEGQYIIYQNGNRFEIGKIKSLTPTGAFVWYSCGDTAAKTPYDCMHPIQNAYVIGETGLGGRMT